ncbi:MAG: hypothetical protein AAB963_01065 [Patescibacteria group bacterium]
MKKQGESSSHRDMDETPATGSGNFSMRANSLRRCIMRHSKVTLRLVVSLLDRFGTVEDLEKFLSMWSLPEKLEDPKYADETLGRCEALLNLVHALGPDVLRRWFAGELKMSFVEVVKMFFNQHGFLDTRDITASHTDPNRDLKLTALEGGWAEYNMALSNLVVRNERLCQFVPSDSGLILPTADEVRGFLARCDGIRARVKDDKLVANVLNGPNLPTFLPKFKVQDLGTFVEVLVTIAKRSYEAEFSGRTFYNHQSGNLAGKVSVVEASRFQQVIAKMAESHVPGLEFFTPFQGFSIPADYEAIALLPQEFILSALDTLMSWALYPDILLNSWSTPGYDLAGLVWGPGPRSLCGKANDGSAGFSGRDLNAHDIFSASLFLPR